MAILEAPCAQNAPGRSTMRPSEALLPRNPTWESSHFSGLTNLDDVDDNSPEDAADDDVDVSQVVEQVADVLPDVACSFWQCSCSCQSD